ncbi:MAG: nucleotidyltransferase domain-containing protein [Selenomonadaceae bacterium]|nr:nucleotidyltransferase domain-containing protein [Selenomonadaceae bacterium]
MQISIIKEAVLKVVLNYPVSRVTLFGSQAAGNARDDSDVDLVVEFFRPVSLMTLSGMKCELEDLLKSKVDLIHGPLRDSDMIEIGQEVVLYAA